MAIYSMFLDKDNYFGKGIHLTNQITINDLSDIVHAYLDLSCDIDTIYIAGACYGKAKREVEVLIDKCFTHNPKKEYKIALMRKYRGFSFHPTADVIASRHTFLGVMFNSKRSDHRKMIFFLSQDKVCAILIGSSNFSPNTYLKKYSSEADLFLVEDTIVNANFICKLKQYNDRMAEVERYGREKSIKSNFLISKSLPSNYSLQSIFEKMKVHTTIEDIER